MMATESDHRHVNEETPPPPPRDPRQRFYRRERASVPAAHVFASAALADWGVQESRGYDITVCVSELVTNALLHGVPPGRGYQLCLSQDGDVLRVEVHDSGGGWPRLGGEGDADESGRGLLLVAALADTWGVTERDPGKIVWCEFGTGRPPAPRWPVHPGVHPAPGAYREAWPVSQPKEDCCD
ncbi:hypothetical protein SALBM135S_05129 [Streptomyces alboniger]